MLSCYHNGELNYITKIEDFREVMEDSVYDCLIEFFYELQEEIDDSHYKIEWLEKENNNLKKQISEIEEH